MGVMGQYSGFRTVVGVAVRSLFADDRTTVPKRHGARPIVLIHGFAAHSRVLLPLECYLRRTLKRPIVRVALGPGFRNIRECARKVDKELDRIAARGEFDYADIVGHSMGGLVASYLLKRIDCGKRVRRVVTLGTPHGGTRVALLGVLAFGLVSRSIWQMLPQSPLVRELRELPVPAGSQLVSIAASDDALVPMGSARVARQPRQRNAKVGRANHWELLLSAPVFGRVRHAMTRR
jgi:triacylglycerol lipase